MNFLTIAAIERAYARPLASRSGLSFPDLLLFLFSVRDRKELVGSLAETSYWLPSRREWSCSFGWRKIWSAVCVREWPYSSHEGESGMLCCSWAALVLSLLRPRSAS